MTGLESRITTEYVSNHRVAVFWLGQAGFVFKSDNGTIVTVDPYLSDCCERYFGFKRLMPKLLSPQEFETDILIATHCHYDHFDVDAVPMLLENGQTRLICTVDVKKEAERLHLNEKQITYIRQNDKLSIHDIEITATPCDHGELAPDAVGILLTISGKRIYLMGDTAYRPDLLENPLLQSPDLLILPINGAFGNLNEEQAAKTVAALKPVMAVPCHFWNFAEHGGNPDLFVQNLKKYAPGQSYQLMAIGGKILI